MDPRKKKPEDDEKPWETAKTSYEMDKILNPRTRMPPVVKPDPEPRDPAATLAEREAERMAARNRTVSKRVGGWSRYVKGVTAGQAATGRR